MPANDALTLLLASPDPALVRMPEVSALAGALAGDLAGAVGREVSVRAVPLAEPDGEGFAAALESEARRAAAVFILPAELQLDIFGRRHLADAANQARRDHPKTGIFYDAPAPCHPLILSALTESCLAAARELGATGPGDFGLVLAASGEGDAEVRADSYKLMRLVWEETGASRAGTGFVRHANPMLARVLRRMLREPGMLVAAAQYLWPCDHYRYAETMVRDAAREAGVRAAIARPLCSHPNIHAWFRQRALEMWWDYRLKTQRPAVRIGAAIRRRPAASAGLATQP
jgi:sirohydrochlorin ferrochelatase